VHRSLPTDPKAAAPATIVLATGTPGPTPSYDQDTTHPRSAEDRLLAAVTELAAGEGYTRLSVEKILRVAAVSRATFYQYFRNLDDCFWSAYGQHAETLVERIAAHASGNGDPRLGMLDALSEAAATSPGSLRMLLGESLAAGPMGARERDGLIARIAALLAGTGGAASYIDLPDEIIIGATFRFLTMLLAGETSTDALAEDLRLWAAGFRRTPPEVSWSTRFTPVHAERAPAAPAPPKRRTQGTPRERIINATAALSKQTGYAATSVGDIVAAAAISRRHFYNHFPSRAAAFIGAYEHGFEQTLAACAPAFFAADTWPERVWQSAQAFTSFLAREPALSYLGFVEGYSLGRDFERRVHGTHLAFTLFLEEGYRQRPDTDAPSRAVSALTAAAVGEVAYQAARDPSSMQIRRAQPLAVYIALSPFIGSDEAGRFVLGKLSSVVSVAASAR
jgi:AcrR family transcriptional regulator